MELGYVVLLSSIAALGFALVNLLIAGCVLGNPSSRREKLAVALGAGGVGTWGLAWFVALYNPLATSALATAGAWAVVVAVSGFAFDALRLLDPLRRRGLLGAAAASFVVGTVIAGGFDATSASPRALAVTLMGVAAVAHLGAAERASGEQALFSRRLWRAAAACALWYAGATIAGVLTLQQASDPELLAVLCAEVLTLVYLVHRRVDLRALVTRGVAYTLLALAVTLAAVLVFRLLGYPTDAVQITSTVAVALFAALLFMGFGDTVNDRLERVLFPDRTRLTYALGASRGEIAALRRRLERVERLSLVGEMAASVAHELKNPVAPIRGYAQLLSEHLDALSGGDRALFEKALRIIGEETDRIDDRVGELLRLARGERRAPGEAHTADLNRVVLEAIAVAEGEPAVPRIVARLDAGVGSVGGSEDELRGVVVNLLRNAAEAMHGTDGAQIEVVTRREADGRAVVEVLDEGIGLTVAEAGRVFEPFYTTKAEGTGLGMAIAQSAVQAAGGRIRIGPRADRRGALVAVELAVVQGRP